MQMMRSHYGAGSSAELPGMEDAGSGEQLFTDTYDEDVRAAALLGIVNGVGNGRFNPGGKITREQAATMMKRAADVMGITRGAVPPEYDDAGEISQWAEEAVYFIGTLVTGAGTAVMQGTGGYRFSPKGDYTTEQAILSVYRLFECAE